MITEERISSTYDRRVFLTVQDEDDMPGAARGTMFVPRLLTVEFGRRKEHEPWQVAMIVASGPVRKKDGEPGLRHEEYAWGPGEEDTMPEWVQKAVRLAVEGAERDRTTVPANGGWGELNALARQVLKVVSLPLDEAEPVDVHSVVKLLQMTVTRADTTLFGLHQEGYLRRLPNSVGYTLTQKGRDELQEPDAPECMCRTVGGATGYKHKRTRP